ncbi:hypothetical protein DHEL01_v210787 [Diaporthe helianthi]|uniref:Uncharacterized protein n=1 Tax=Diaporthe helianthi TaxID=158607 RepID=A0A2P5HKN8_DIAHE|nr:hypothetical protein DHEL01_v210787 [Diaporthe helianthi]
MGSYIHPSITQGVNLAFTAIMIVPLVVILCLTFSRAPRSNDPARGSIPYLMVMLPLALIWLVMTLIAGILGFASTSSPLGGGGDILHAQVRIGAIASLAAYWSDILIIMVLVELGNGFLFCVAEARTGLQKGMRYVAIGTSAILAILAIAIFGITNAEVSKYFHSGSPSVDDSLGDARVKLGTVIIVVTFIWSVALVAFAAIVLYKARHNYALKNSAILFLVATIMNLISHLYILIYTAMFVLTGFILASDYETYTAIMFVDPILNIWTWVVALSLVCTILIRKQKGLWATMQPWMDQQGGPPALAGNPNSKGLGEHWKQPSESHVVGV